MNDIKEWEFRGLEDLPRAYKVFGGNLPMIVVFATCVEKALCLARCRDATYCAAQPLTVKSWDESPAVLKETEFLNCHLGCLNCEDLSEHFAKSSCAIKIPDVCGSGGMK